MLCSERERLLDDYDSSVKTYSARVSELVNKAKGALEDDLNLVRRNCRLAWEQAEQARLLLARHEANHFCDRPELLKCTDTTQA